MLRASLSGTSGNTALYKNYLYLYLIMTMISDFDKEHIRVQLQLLGTNVDDVIADGAMNIFHVKEYLLCHSARGSDC